MRTRRRYPSIKEAREAIRQLDRSTVKLAELGGDGQDAPFEQALSNLAHAYLRDKAPSLLDHELGFQLLDRNQDNTKAVGVFGFKVGSQRLFAPVFFLQGDLKGHELLYIKNQDLFVPLKENWLNYILNRKPQILGESVSRNTSLLGVRQPDLNRLSRSPSKYASAMPDWLRDTLPVFYHAATLNTRTELTKYAAQINLPRFCQQFATLNQLQWLVKQAQTYPAIAQAITNHHGSLDFLHTAVQAAARRLKTANTHSVLDARLVSKYQPLTGSILDTPQHDPKKYVKSAKLQVIEFDLTQQTDLPEMATEEDQEKLLNDGVLIKDERGDDEVSVPYNIQVEKRLTNPSETGLYQVLVKPGKFEKCFVAIHPYGTNGRAGFATIVRIDGTRSWLNCHPSRIWVGSRIEGKEYTDWYDSLPEASSLTTGNSRYMLLSPRGNATLPFKATKSYGDADGQSYEVSVSDYCSQRYPEITIAPDSRYDNFSSDDSYDSYHDGARIHLDSKDGTAMRSNRGDLWIPKNSKKLSVEPERSEGQSSDPCCFGDRSTESPIRPGNLLDAELAVMSKTAKVTIKHAGSQITINQVNYNPRGALVHLVREHGLRADTARHILKEASNKGRLGNNYTFHIKYAQPGGDPYLTAGGPTAPTMPDPVTSGGNVMGWDGPTIQQGEQTLAVPGMESGQNSGAYDVKSDLGGRDAGIIQQALQSGQKEVFDTAMIGSMLKAVREDSMIDKYIPDLLKGMDRLGRLLFMFYWHMDTFADRYGKQDLPELEDTLRNSFEMMGDCVLFLKQKTIEPYPEEDSTDLDLTQSAN